MKVGSVLLGDMRSLKKMRPVLTKRGDKSILPLLRYKHSKKVEKISLNVIFESSPYLKSPYLKSPYLKRYKSYSQLWSGSQVEDIAIVPHVFACSSYRPPATECPFCRRRSHTRKRLLGKPVK